MIVRHAGRADLAPALRHWTQHLGVAFPLTERVLGMTIFDDPTFCAGDALAAVDDDRRLLGFGWLKRWREPWLDSRFAHIGFIGGLVVDHQRRGIGSALLTALEQRMRAEGCERVEISGGLLHVLRGLPVQAEGARAFFEGHGYVFDEDRHYDLLGDLRSYTAEANAAARVASDSDADRLAEFLAREFPGSWQLHARWHLTHGGRASDFVVLDIGGRIEGFCHIFRPGAWPAGPSTYWGDNGGLGPIGVSAALRGRGLGRALLDASLLELQASGVTQCAIDWTRLVDFYSRFGFAPSRAYYRGHKRLVE